MFGPAPPIRHQVGHLDPVHLRQQQQRPQRRLPPSTLNFLKVLVGNPTLGNLLLREPRGPAGFAEVEGNMLEKGGQFHAPMVRSGGHPKHPDEAW